MTAPTATLVDCRGTWIPTYRESPCFQDVLRCSGCREWMVILDPIHAHVVEAASFDEAVEKALDLQAHADAYAQREIELEQMAQDAIIDADDSVEVTEFEYEARGCECEIDWDCGCGAQRRHWARVEIDFERKDWF